MNTADIVAAAGGPFGFSRALPPLVKRELLDTGDGTELPAVGGHSVVPADWDRPVVLGHPNYFGRFEPEPRHGVILLAGAWAVLGPIPPGAVVVEHETPIPAHLAEPLVRHARRLAKRLSQHRGVSIPFTPESPVIVALLPRSAEVAGDGVTTLSDDFPEFPGGVRVELPVDVAVAGSVRYAERLERLVREGT